MQVLDVDETGEPVPFTVDDLSSSLYPDILCELQPLETFTGFVKGVRKPIKSAKPQKIAPTTTPTSGSFLAVLPFGGDLFNHTINCIFRHSSSHTARRTCTRS